MLRLLLGQASCSYGILSCVTETTLSTVSTLIEILLIF